MNSRLQQKIEWSFPRAPRSLVISDLPIKEGTVLFLEQNLLWWRGSQGSVWNGHVWSIHHARNALRWVGCILVSHIRWTQRLSRSYSCLGYAPCKLPKATLILHTELGPAVSTPAGAGRGFPFLNLMAAGTQLHKGTPLSRTRGSQPGYSATVRWAAGAQSLSDTVQPSTVFGNFFIHKYLHFLGYFKSFSALSFFSHERTPFPRKGWRV